MKKKKIYCISKIFRMDAAICLHIKMHNACAVTYEICSWRFTFRYGEPSNPLYIVKGKKKKKLLSSNNNDANTYVL